MLTRKVSGFSLEAGRWAATTEPITHSRTASQQAIPEMAALTFLRTLNYMLSPTPTACEPDAGLFARPRCPRDSCLPGTLRYAHQTTLSVPARLLS